MKRIFFVRHGSTDASESDIYQLITTPLSKKGRGQAEFLAERLSKISFDVLISSDMTRALQTADIIGSKTNHNVVVEPLFREVRRPSGVIGKSRNDPQVLEIMRVAHHNFFGANDAKHSDEENFHDLSTRARKALAYLVSRAEETMVVVTHGIILNMLVAVMFAEETLTPEMFKRVYNFVLSSNTGLTHCEYDNKYHPEKWALITWNDRAHLG